MVDRVNPQQFIKNVGEAAASPAATPSGIDQQEYQALKDQYLHMYMGNTGRATVRAHLAEKYPALVQSLEADFQAARVGRAVDGYEGYVARLMSPSATAIV